MPDAQRNLPNIDYDREKGRLVQTEPPGEAASPLEPSSLKP